MKNTKAAKEEYSGGEHRTNPSPSFLKARTTKWHTKETLLLRNYDRNGKDGTRFHKSHQGPNWEHKQVKHLSPFLVLEQLTE